MKKDHFKLSFINLIFFALVFALPFYKTTIINIFNIGVGLPYIIFAVLLLFCCLRLVYLGKFRTFSSIKFLLVLWLIFLIYLFISVWWTPLKTFWAYQFTRIAASLFFFIFPIVIIQKKKPLLDKTINVFIATSAIFIVDTIIRVHGTLTLSSSNVWDFYAALKKSYLVCDTNTVGIYIGLILTLILYRLLKNNKKKTGYLILLFICIAVLFSTLSRGAIAAVSISWIIGFIFLLRPVLSRQNKRKVLGATLAGIGIFAVIIIGLNSLQSEGMSFLAERYLGLASFAKEAGFVDRIRIWNIAWNMFKDSPLIGWGVGGLGARFENYQIGVSYPYVHNLYLSILTVGGLIGFSLFGLWMGFILLFLLKISKKSLLARLGVIGILIYLIQGLVMFELADAYLWLYIGIILVGANIEAKEEFSKNKDSQDNVLQ